MKLFNNYKFIFFVCIIVLIFQTGCGKNSLKSTPDTTQDTSNTEMNFTQIQAGDYSSLLGTWKEIAYSDNAFDGKGQQWHVGRSDTTANSLTVSADKIKYNGSAMIIQGNTLTDSNSSHQISFYNGETILRADLVDKSTPINWSATFYSKGAENNLEPNNGVQIDNTKNLIVVWYSGMRVLTVFGQEE